MKRAVIAFTALVILIVGGSSWATAQSYSSNQNGAVPCTTTIENSPSLRGFKLGMSREQVTSQFRVAGVQPTPNTDSDSVSWFRNSNSEGTDLFRDVNRVAVYFFENRLKGIDVDYYLGDPFFYNYAVNYKLISEALHRSLNVLASSNYQSLECQGFGISYNASRVGINNGVVSLRFKDLLAEAEIARRRKAKLDLERKQAAEKAATFRP
jgi:hypothetical protein